MSSAIEIPVLIVAGYLLGTIPSAVWVARSRGVDIYSVGSGNPGASNVYRALGKGAAALVFAIDALKGVIPAAAGRWMPGGTVAFGLIGGMAAVVGHTWPVFRKFKGGRGVATGAGVLAVCYPVLTLAMLAVFAIVVGVTRKPSIASLVALVGAVIGVIVIGRDLFEIVLVLLMAALVLARHTENIKRLIRGEEHGLAIDDSSSDESEIPSGASETP